MKDLLSKEQRIALKSIYHYWKAVLSHTPPPTPHPHFNKKTLSSPPTFLLFFKNLNPL